MSDRSKIGAGIIALAVVIVLFVVLSGGGNGDSNGSDQEAKTAGKTAEVPVIHLRGGEPVGGLADVTVTSGEQVRFRVTSDIEGEVHVHGYDFEKPIKAGGSVSFDFPAKLEGAFEIELHHGGGENTIADLKVEPG